MNDSLILLIALVVGLFLVYVVLSLAKKSGSEEWKDLVKTKSHKIRQSLTKNNPAEIEGALIQADKLLDFALRHKKVKGNTLGERLKNAKNLYDRSFYNSIWDAHKLRNRFVHEVDANISTEKIKSQVKILLSASNRLL